MPDDLQLGTAGHITDQWLRVWRVLLVNEQGGASVLAGNLGGGAQDVWHSEVITGQEPTAHEYAAGLRIHFIVNQSIAQTPNTAEITLYNLAEETAQSLIREFNFVVLQAGYEWGRLGTIFSGTIKMFKTGHENVTDSYLRLYAGDGDVAYVNSRVNTSVAPDTPPEKRLEEIKKEFPQNGVEDGRVEMSALAVGPNIRREVWYGPAADALRDYAQANAAGWHILHQRFYWTKPNSYEPGDFVNLTSATGLIGFPEMTQDGINVTALINPAIRLRQRLRIDNRTINQYWTPGGASGFERPGVGFTNLFAPVQADGIYAPMMINYEGDSRGGPWYMFCVCAAVDSTKDILAALAGLFWNPLN